MDDRRSTAAGRRTFDDVTQDALRRTRLANERTYLAWWRTGLTSLAVSFGVGKLVPVLTDSTAWVYEALGAGFAFLGVLCLAYGYLRERTVERALRRGEFSSPDERVMLFLTVLGVLLGVVTMAIVAFGD